MKTMGARIHQKRTECGLTLEETSALLPQNITYTTAIVNILGNFCSKKSKKSVDGRYVEW